MVYRDFKDLARTKVADKVIRDEAFKNPKYDRCQHGLALKLFIVLSIKNLQVEQLKTKLFLIKN